MSGVYDDIIDLAHHVSPTRPQMSMYDRAAQFSPFAALTGHNAAIRETARLTDSRPELSENERELLDIKLGFLLERSGEQPPLSLCCFIADEKKSGGRLEDISGTLQRLDSCRRLLWLNSADSGESRSIPLDDIVDIDSPLLDAAELAE